MSGYIAKAKTFENMRDREHDDEMSDQEALAYCDNCGGNTVVMPDCDPMHREDVPSCSDCFRSYERCAFY